MIDDRIIKYFEIWVVIDEETMWHVFTFTNKKNREIKSFKQIEADELREYKLNKLL